MKIPGIENKIKTLLSKYECEYCGRCCRHERVTITREDKSRNRKLSGAIQENLIMGYSTLKLPCPFISYENKCTCYLSRPLACRRYPMIEKYPGYFTISRCPYGDKIIDPVMQFCKDAGINIDQATDHENIMEIDQIYRDIGVGQKEAQLCISIPAATFQLFFNWFLINYRGEKGEPL